MNGSSGGHERQPVTQKGRKPLDSRINRKNDDRFTHNVNLLYQLTSDQ